MSVGRAPGPGSLTRRALPAGGSSWTLAYTDALGRRRRVVLGADKRVAERRRADIIRKRDLELAGLGTEEGQSRPLAEVVTAYLADLRHHAGERHLINVQLKLRKIQEGLGPVRVRDVTPVAVLALRNDLVDQGRSHRTANLYASTLSAALHWAAENRLIAENPIEHLKRLPEGPRHQVRRRRAMSEDEIGRFLVAAAADDRACEAEQARSRTARIRGPGALADDLPRVPQAPFWRALVETGARYGELVRATWSDLDLRARLLRLRAETTKGERERVLPLRRGLVGDLMALRAIHEQVLGRPVADHDRVFLSPEGSPWAHYSTNATRIFGRVLAAAGIARVDEHGSKLDIHALRHTAATRLARAGVGLVHAQRILGHSDPKLTARVYTHVEAEGLRDAVDRLPSVGDGQARRGA